VPCVLHCVYRVVRDGASDAALTRARGSQMKGGDSAKRFFKRTRDFSKKIAKSGFWRPYPDFPGARCCRHVSQSHHVTPSRNFPKKVFPLARRRSAPTALTHAEAKYSIDPDHSRSLPSARVTRLATHTLAVLPVLTTRACVKNIRPFVDVSFPEPFSWPHARVAVPTPTSKPRRGGVRRPVDVKRRE